MQADHQISRIMAYLADVVTCPVCETRIRFGDHECPHCGEDIEEELHRWAAELLEKLFAGTGGNSRAEG